MSQLSEAFKQFDTSYLTKARNELIHAIPGDATFTSHVGMILRALLAHELGQRAAAAPQKLAEVPDDSPPHEWPDPDNPPPPEEESAGPPPGWTDPAPGPPNEPPPPTPSTRAAPPRPTRPPPRDW